jgi:hypothetical protein
MELASRPSLALCELHYRTVVRSVCSPLLIGPATAPDDCA